MASQPSDSHISRCHLVKSCLSHTHATRCQLCNYLAQFGKVCKRNTPVAISQRDQFICSNRQTPVGFWFCGACGLLQLRLQMGFWRRRDDFKSHNLQDISPLADGERDSLTTGPALPSRPSKVEYMSLFVSFSANWPGCFLRWLNCPYVGD